MKKAYVVGCGITGSIIARFLAEELNFDVTIFERRNHIAGNLYDYKDGNGILVQKYGPHIFHTNSRRVYDYVTRFAAWVPFKLRCMVEMNGKSTPSPFNYKTIDDYYSPDEAAEIKKHIEQVYSGRDRATIVEMLECQDPVVKAYAQFLFDNDYSLYTAKQWGIPPSDIDISVLKRVPVLFSYEEAYFNDTYEMMPEGGFTAFIASILDHHNICIRLSTDALDHLSVETDGKLRCDGELCDGPVIWTGMLDEFFGFSEGVLPYRSLKFEWQTHDTNSFQQAPVVSYPQEKGFTRITEYTKLPEQRGFEKTTIAIEYPLPYAEGEKNEPYYPVVTADNTNKYRTYKRKAQKIKGFYPCGRLAQYKYYNIDQAIEAALDVCDQFALQEK